MAWGDRVIDDEAQYPRTLPQLGDDTGRIVTSQDVDKWWGDTQRAVADAREKVLEIGVDAVVAALEDLGVITQERDWDDF